MKKSRKIKKIIKPSTVDFLVSGQFITIVLVGSHVPRKACATSQVENYW